MAYRDELEAALQHADAAERDLERARGEIASDEKRIAELEKQLKEARARAERMQAQPPSVTTTAQTGTPRRMAVVVAGVLLASGAAGYFLFRAQAPERPRPKVTPPAAPAPAPALPAGDVDLGAMLGTATGMARNTFSDAQLTRIDAEYVDEAGVARLHYGGYARFDFRSPSRVRGAPTPLGPVGAPVKEAPNVECELDLRVSQDKPLHVYSQGGDCSHATPVPSLRCTVPQVWAKARDAGAPAGTLATIGLRQHHDAFYWRFYITDHVTGKSVFSKDIDDDCR
jgi:hypothetical protein